MLSKNSVCNVNIVDLSAEGSGVGKINNFIVFIEGALPGDTCEIKIIKVKKTYAYGKILKIISPSIYRVESSCPVFKKCGGCTLHHLEYSAQLKIKKKQVENSLNRIGDIKDIKVDSIEGMINPYNYRNKVQFPVRGNSKNIEVGFYQKSSHRVVDFDSCLIQNPINEKIINIVKNHMYKYGIHPYNEISHEGCVRHIFTRVGNVTNEVMVCLVVKGKNSNVIKNKEELIKELLKLPNMTSILLNYNNNKTNTILGDKVETLFGKDYIIDYIGNIEFKISCKSFYQINSTQAEKLYRKVLEFLNVNKTDVVLDIYCGIGTISLFLAEHAKKVFGVEVVEDAVQDAVENAKINNIQNIKFIVGKAEEVIPKYFTKQSVDMAVLDPPRKGCHEDLLHSVLKIEPKKIIYISCNPSTLARDLKVLCKNDYKIVNVIPYDFFPHTMHVECIVQLVR